MSNVITNIETRDGIVSLAASPLAAGHVADGRVRGGLLWGGIGQTVDAPMRLEEALTLARADFNVSKRTVFYPTNAVMAVKPDERKNMPMALAIGKIPGARVVTRDDIGIPLGIVNRTYPTVSNRRTLAAALGATLDDAGRVTSERDDSRITALAVLGNG